MHDSDFLDGASEIALYLFGSDDPSSRDKVYKLKQRRNVPFHKLSGRLCLRISRFLAWVAAQEDLALKGPSNHTAAPDRKAT